MAIINMIAVVVAALLCASGALGARELQNTYTYTPAPCVSYMGGTVSSTSGVAFASNFTQAFKNCFKEFCSTGAPPGPPCSGTCDPGPLVPTSPVVANALAEAAPALAKATAQAMTSVMSKGFIAGDCSGFSSTVSASAKALTMARAISTSYASAFASVVGAASYSPVSSIISMQSTILQAECRKHFTEINNGPTQCVNSTVACNSTNIPGGTSRWNSLSPAQQAKCWIITCSFAQDTSNVTTIVETSAQAIINATATVTSTNGTGVCSYDGPIRLCAQFTALCNAQCINGTESCPNPAAEEFCPDDMGNWAELPNGDYQCQPAECVDPNQTIQSVCEPCPGDNCNGEQCHWECKPITAPVP